MTNTWNSNDHSWDDPNFNWAEPTASANISTSRSIPSQRQLHPSTSNDASTGLCSDVPENPYSKDDAQLQSLDSCLAQLALALPRVTAFTNADSNADSKILEILTKPFDELTTAISDLLLPDPDSVNTTSMGSALSSVGDQIAESLRNPFISVVRSQNAALSSSIDQVRTILFTGKDDKNGFFVDYFDRVKTALQSVFLGEDSDGHFCGVFIYAFEHGIQAIEAELFFLRKMRGVTNSLIEEGSKLPSIIDFTLPNASVVEKLCEAEILLKQTADKLRRQSQFDRSRFGQAANRVCEAKDIIFDGKFDSNLLLHHSQNMLGLGAYKAKDLRNIRLLPNVEYKLRLQELHTLAKLFQAQEHDVTELYLNILNAIANIKAMADLQLGDILGLLVDVLRRQISAIRRELQVFGAGYDTTTAMERRAAGISAPGTSPTQIKGQTNDAFKGFDEYKLPNEGIRTDASTYLSSQLSAYLVLENLCTLMQRAPAVYKTIDRIVKFESTVMRTILNLVKRFDVSACGNYQSGRDVTRAVQAYLKAADNRLRQNVPPQHNRLNAAGKQLQHAIDARIEFLSCMKEHMFFGLGRLGPALELVAGGAAILTNIQSMARSNSDTEKELKSLNLKALTGTDREEYTALETLLKAVQCLLLNCDNPMLQDTGRSVIDAFGPRLNKKRSRAFNMGSLDSIPNVAAKARGNRTIQQTMRVLGAIQGILDLDANQLCNSLNADKEREANVHRANSSKAVFGDTPVTSVRPTSKPNQTPTPSRSTQKLSDALVVQSTFYPAGDAVPPPLTPADNSFTTG